MATNPALAGVVLAAGKGTRLAPLTQFLPKALCPVGNVALVDHALARCAALVGTGADQLAVNVHHGAAALVGHLGDRVYASVETPTALGTAGAIGQLRPWLAGRDVVITNADAWLQNAGTVAPATGPDLSAFLDGWDHRRPRLLCVRDPHRGDFGDLRFAGVSVLPWQLAAQLTAEPSGLYETIWRHAAVRGELDLVEWTGTFVDCGTPRDLLAANMAFSGGLSVIADDAHVEGTVTRSVVLAGATVYPREVLTDAIRWCGGTVLSR